MKPTISGRLRRVRNVAGRIAIALGALVLCRVLWHFTQRDDAEAVADGRAESDLVARRDFLAAHVEDAAHSLEGKHDQFAGEQSLVTLSMTALGAANVGFEYSSTVPADLELVGRCAEIARRPSVRAFDAQRWGDDPIDAMNGASSHLGYLGHLALILEANRLLGGRDAELAALEPKVIGALADKLRGAPGALVPTYPNETYVADNAVALAAIALADVGRGVHASGDARHAGPHAALLESTLATWRKNLVDAQTGIFVFGPGDRARPRASGAALTAMMLGYVDEPLALEQGKALAQHFDTHVLGLFDALCENPDCTGSGDVDSGPLVFGASPSATGFALALAKRSRDVARLGDELATAEWAGLGFSWNGRRRYVFAPIVGDAVVLAAMSARAWDVRYL
ncbi:MAG TPA: hypothetical protein VGH28_15120 [Polyangiaceae bacterium]